MSEGATAQRTWALPVGGCSHPPWGRGHLMQGRGHMALAHILMAWGRDTTPRAGLGPARGRNRASTELGQSRSACSGQFKLVVRFIDF